MATKENEAPAVEPSPVGDEQETVEPTSPSPTKSPTPLGTWEPNSPPAH